MKTLQDIFRNLDAYGDHAAVIAFTSDGRIERSFRDLAERARSLAGGLRGKDGIETGERAAIFAPNSAAWIECRLALIAAGAEMVSIDDTLTGEQLAGQLKDARPRLIFTVASHLDEVRAAIDFEARIVLIDAGPEQAGDLDSESWESLRGEPLEEMPEVAPDDVAALFYTSGTTGPPKSVPLTHRNILSNVEGLLTQDLVHPGDRVLLPLPFYHSYPFIVGILMPLVTGAAIVLPAGVSAPQLRDALRDAGPGIVVGVPRLYQALVDGIEGRIRGERPVRRLPLLGLFHLSGFLRRRLGLRWGRWLLRPLHKQLAPKLKIMASGGAKLEASVAWRMESLGWEVLNGYGLVETSSIATFEPRGKARYGSGGLPAPGVEIRIGEPNEAGNGEVQIRGPNVFKGYGNNPEANKEAFTQDGWFRSGDLGYLDEDGYLFIVGRVKEMIVLPGGKNIAPQELEARYADSPYIREIAVVEKDGALIGLVVPDFEAANKVSGRIEDLIRVAIDEASQRLPRHQRLSQWWIAREDLPKTHLGKYRRHKLPEVLARARRGEAPAPAEPTEEDLELLGDSRLKAVFDWLQERFPDQTVSLDTNPQLDLGIDSLAWLNLGMEIEDRFGFNLSEEMIVEVTTVRDLLEQLRDAPEGGDGQRREIDAERWLKAPGPAGQAAGYLLHLLARGLAKAYFRLEVSGRERVPAKGPLIIAFNHVSDVDPLVAGAALDYAHMKRIWWGADADRVFGSWLGRAFARTLHLFPVDDRAPKASLEVAQQVLERGNVLIWFPEEWRSPTGELQRFLPGVGRLIAETDASVVPAFIDGAFEAMPRDRRLPRPVKIHVRFGAVQARSDLEAIAPGEGGEEERLAEGLKRKVAEVAEASG